jgi:hypothetical protein
MGGLFIAVIVGLAAYDTLRSHRAALSETGRELDAQARVIAEQTARTLQTVDLVSRHIAEELRSGKLDHLDARALHDYLHDQAVGLVQIAGLALVDARGRMMASSNVFPLPEQLPDLSSMAVFERLRIDRGIGLEVENATRGVLQPDLWIFPLVRRLARRRPLCRRVAAARVEYPALLPRRAPRRRHHDHADASQRHADGALSGDGVSARPALQAAGRCSPRVTAAHPRRSVAQPCRRRRPLRRSADGAGISLVT